MEAPAFRPVNTAEEKDGLQPRIGVSLNRAEIMLFRKLRSLSAAVSGVMSRCGVASSSYPTMNFCTVADRNNGGK